jgi:hypothetical protein
MNKPSTFAVEMAGAVFISVLGSLLHFMFAFVGGWPPAALIAAVNESVWEHLKLAFWPAILFALITWPIFRKNAKNYWTARAFGILTMPVIITSGFYGYTAAAGRNFLWADISLFVLAVFCGQLVSLGLLRKQTFAPSTKILAAILLVLMIAAFSLFTFFPPRGSLFRDPRTGQHGIPV